MHPFEKSGLGQAPFKCFDVQENVFVMPDGSTKAGGSCDYCGTGIRWEFLIASSDGKTFKVGCDCVEKTNRRYGVEVENFRAIRLEHTRQRRQAGAQSRKEARQKAWDEQRKAWAAERLEATAEWRNENAALLARLEAAKATNDFLSNMAQAVAYYGRLTDNQKSSVERALDRIDTIERQRKTSEFVGAPGQRIKNAKLRVTSTIVIGKEPFYPYAPRYLIALEDEKGNALTWFTGTSAEPFSEFEQASFTVKDHSVYKGVNQTIVQRVKWS